MTSPRLRVALDMTAPSSRASFRLVAKSVGATNRECDSLRTALLGRWADVGGASELDHRLQELGTPDADGTYDVDGLLAVWFGSGDAVEGRLVAEDDAILASLSDELRTHLVAMSTQPPGETDADEEHVADEVAADEPVIVDEAETELLGPKLLGGTSRGLRS